MRRLLPDVSRDDEWNVLRVSVEIFFQIANESERLSLRPGSPEAKWRARSIKLDPSQHAWLLDSYSASSAAKQMIHRLGVTEEAARTMVAEALRDERLADWLAIDPEVKVSRERLAPLVSALLAAPAGPRWSAQNDLARRVHQETNLPFAEAKTQIASLERIVRGSQSGVGKAGAVCPFDGGSEVGFQAGWSRATRTRVTSTGPISIRRANER